MWFSDDRGRPKTVLVVRCDRITGGFWTSSSSDGVAGGVVGGGGGGGRGRRRMSIQSPSSRRLCFLFFIFFVLKVGAGGGGGGGGGSVIQIKIPGKSLRFANSSTFKIALFADLHFGENAWMDWGPFQDVNSQAVMSTVLDRENPDFVIYLGDVITANNIPIQNASQYWDQAIAPTRERGIPWASVFGNHDDMPFVWPSEWFSSVGIPEIRCSSLNATLTSGSSCCFKGTTRKELLEKEMENDLSITLEGPSFLWPGVSNYVLRISSSKDEEEPNAYLYFLDSGGGSYPEVISAAQSRWFEQESERLNPEGRVPEIIFWHIPSLAFKSVAPWFGIHKPCVGSINKEKVAAQQAEWGIMHVLTARKSVKAVFVGHNHGLDWCCPYKSLWLCFARHTGYGGYGNWARGARILELHEDPFFLKSWIRMEDGAVHSKVTLAH